MHCRGFPCPWTWNTGYNHPWYNWKCHTHIITKQIFCWESLKTQKLLLIWRFGAWVRYSGYPDLQSFQVEPSPCLPFFISVIVFWIMTFFHRQNSVRLRCFFAETDIIQSVSTLLASFFVSSGVELRKTVYYKIVRYSKYLCTLSLPLAYVLTRTWVCSSKNEDTGSSVGYRALSVRTWGHIGHCLLTDVLLSLSLRTIHSQHSGTAGLQVAGCCRTGIK